jgi:hypothetical protein
MYDKKVSIMACACKNKSTNNAQVTRVKQVVKSRSVTPTASSVNEGGHKVTKRVIYRRSV